MREIKFRAWDSINKLWVDPFKLILMKCGSVQSVQSLDGEIYGTHQVFLNQYTGLKDENGKEIYEGDIIKDAQGDIGYVIFSLHDNLAEYIITRDGENGWYFWDSEPIEIIGNIHENPNLLDSHQ